MTGDKWIEQELHDILVNVGENYEHGYGDISIDRTVDQILSLCQENIYKCPTCHEYGIALIYNAWVGGSGNVEHRECVRCRDKRWRESNRSRAILQARMETGDKK